MVAGDGAYRAQGLGRLVETLANRTEDRQELRAKSVHHSDDGDEDAGEDEAIFHGARACVVAQKLPDTNSQKY